MLPSQDPAWRFLHVGERATIETVLKDSLRFKYKLPTPLRMHLEGFMKYIIFNAESEITLTNVSRAYEKGEDGL